MHLHQALLASISLSLPPSLSIPLSKFQVQTLASSINFVALVSLAQRLLMWSLIVRTDLRQQSLVGDAEFGLILVAAMDAIQAGVREGHEWHSDVLPNGNILCLDKEGGEWTLDWEPPKAKKQRLHNEMVVASETSRAKKTRLHDEVVSASETSKA